MEFAILCFKLGIINSGLKAGAKWLNPQKISAVNSRAATRSKLGLVESPLKDVLDGTGLQEMRLLLSSFIFLLFQDGL